MKRLAMVTSCLLIAAACSDSGRQASSATSVTAPSGSVASVSATSVSATSVTATSITPQPVDSSSPAPAPTAAAQTDAALTPFVVCINFNAATYFGYRNEADQVVSVDPASSAVAGAEPDDEAYVPTLFAPGRVSPAFYVFAVDPDIPVSWTITGTDGVGRTATSDPQVPECTDELLQPTVPDERTPSIEIGAPQLSADGSTVTIETTAVGIPTLSVCADGLTAEPASVGMDDGNGGSTTAGNVSQWTADVLTFQPEGRRVATFIVSALVVDRCSGADVTQSSWPNGAFDDMRNGLTICATVTNTTVSIDSFYGGLCGGLAPTGGARIRPSANAG